MYWRELILDRTIGIQYLIALSQKLFGENNFSPYIPNILAGSLMIFLTSKIHKQLLRDNSNIVSSLILSTTFMDKLFSYGKPRFGFCFNSNLRNVFNN